MGDKTKIQWTDASWNPLRAHNIHNGKVGWFCTHATTGCINCYAESINKRLGTGLPFKPGHLKDVEVFLDEDMLTQPLRWKKPRMIFVCSMTDLFGDFVPDAFIDKMFAVMALCPQHVFQVLTKRHDRMRDYIAGIPSVGSATAPGRIWATGLGLMAQHNPKHDPLSAAALLAKWPFPNVWLGVSAENQEQFESRWSSLRETPAAIRFLSIEPQIGRIDMCEMLGIWQKQTQTWTGFEYSWVDIEPKPVRPDWVIVGGESGPNARDFNIEWAESLIDQCAGAGAKCFIKQLGAQPWRFSSRSKINQPLVLSDSKGGKIEEWPEHLRVREMPEVRT